MIGNGNGEAAAADSLGYAHHNLGQNEEAVSWYDHALKLYRELNDRYLEANTLTHIGDARLAVDDHNAATAAWRQALEILDELGHPDANELRNRAAGERSPV